MKRNLTPQQFRALQQLHDRAQLAAQDPRNTTADAVAHAPSMAATLEAITSLPTVQR